MRIDAHHHLWQYNQVDYAWIGDEERVLKQDFDTKSLEAVCIEHKIDGTVAVQARQSHEETDWLISLAERCEHICAVVGWVDLKSECLGETLQSWSSKQKLKGFRHVLQDEPDDDFMLEPNFVNGLRVIAEYGYTYDLLIFSRQLPQALSLAKQVPELEFVIDHIAKPNIADKSDFKEWSEHILDIAKLPNVSCKISGMVTEAVHQKWNEKEFTPYMDVILKAFGPQKIMFGSDWPVCLLSANYEQVLAILETFIANNCPEFEKNIMGLNAKAFYKI